MTDEEYRAAVKENPDAVFDVLADAYVEGGAGAREALVPHNPVTKKVIDPSRWAERQISGAQGAGSRWLEGVQNPSRSPIAAGIAAEDKWRSKIQQAITENRRVKGLQKSSDDIIKANATALGPGVFSSGVAARATKIRNTVASLQPLMQAVSDTVQGMPDKTDADRDARALKTIQLMREVGKKRRG